MRPRVKYRIVLPVEYCAAGVLSVKKSSADKIPNKNLVENVFEQTLVIPDK